MAPPLGVAAMHELHDSIVTDRLTALRVRTAHPKWAPTLTPVSKSLEAAAGHLNDFLDGDPSTCRRAGNLDPAGGRRTPERRLPALSTSRTTPDLRIDPPVGLERQ
jgi:hypothetical protein